MSSFFPASQSEVSDHDYSDVNDISQISDNHADSLTPPLQLPFGDPHANPEGLQDTQALGWDADVPANVAPCQDGGPLVAVPCYICKSRYQELESWCSGEAK